MREEPARPAKEERWNGRVCYDQNEQHHIISILIFECGVKTAAAVVNDQ